MKPEDFFQSTDEPTEGDYMSAEETATTLALWKAGAKAKEEATDGD